MKQNILVHEVHCAVDRIYDPCWCVGEFRNNAPVGGGVLFADKLVIRKLGSGMIFLRALNLFSLSSNFNYTSCVIGNQIGQKLLPNSFEQQFFDGLVRFCHKIGRTFFFRDVLLFVNGIQNQLSSLFDEFHYFGEVLVNFGFNYLERHLQFTLTDVLVTFSTICCCVLVCV